MKYLTNYKKTKFNKNQVYHGVLELKTNKLLALTNYMISATKLSETIHNSFCLYYINTPNIHFIPKKENFDFVSNVINFDNFDITQLYYYRIFQSSLKKDVVIDDVSTSELNVNRGNALDYINKFIIHFRRPYNMDIALQHETYHLKYLEALDFYDNKREIYPFLENYANLKNISLEQSAKEIKFQAELYMSALANIENLRIKYTNLILNETNNIENILTEFMNEGVFYGHM